MKANKRFIKRQKRVRGLISQAGSRPRLTVSRSNKHISAQIIDVLKNVALASENDISQKQTKKTKTEKARTVGEEIAKKALKKKIKKVVFDRSGYKYHGRVKALAEGSRAGGLVF